MLLTARPQGLCCDAFGLSTVSVRWEASLHHLKVGNVVIAATGRASRWQCAMNQLAEMRSRAIEGDEVTGAARAHQEVKMRKMKNG